MFILVRRFKFQCVKFSYIPHSRVLPVDFYMLSILPDESFGLDEIDNSWDADTIKSLTDERCFRSKGLDLKISKFKLDYEIWLDTVFKLLGITNAFDQNYASFSKISRDIIFVSQAVHKAFIEVNKKGTIAAAATSIEFELQCCRYNKDHPFIVDHPFLIFI